LQYLAHPHVVAQSLEPVRSQELLQAVAVTVKAQHVAHAARCRAVAGEAHTDGVHTLLHQTQMYPVVQGAQ